MTGVISAVLALHSVFHYACFFFFSSRRRHTRCLSDWSSDVCSSDLVGLNEQVCKAIFEALRVRVPESRPLFPDTLSTLAALQQRGFLLGIVTNRQHGGKPFFNDLRTIGLLDYFREHHIAVSADLGVRKPPPALF